MMASYCCCTNAFASSWWSMVSLVCLLSSCRTVRLAECCSTPAREKLRTEPRAGPRGVIDLRPVILDSTGLLREVCRPAAVVLWPSCREVGRGFDSRVLFDS